MPSGYDKEAGEGLQRAAEILCAFFSPTVMWPKRARSALLCVGYTEGRDEEWRGEGGGCAARTDTCL